MYNSGRLTGYIIVLIVIVVVCALIGTWITQIVWAWVVPDIFRGAVKAGLLPAALTFWQAFKLSILTTILFGASKTSFSSSK